MKLLTSQAFYTLHREFDGHFGRLVVHFALCCVDSCEGELNSPDLSRERFCSRVQEHLHHSLVFKALVSLSSINISGNLNKVDEKSIIWSGDLDTENCMVFTFLRGIQYQEGLRSPLAALQEFKKVSCSALSFSILPDLTASSASLG